MRGFKNLNLKASKSEKNQICYYVFSITYCWDHCFEKMMTFWYLFFGYYAIRKTRHVFLVFSTKWKASGLRLEKGYVVYLKKKICNGKTENKYVNNIVPNPLTEKYRRHKIKSGRARNIMYLCKDGMSWKPITNCDLTWIENSVER